MPQLGEVLRNFERYDEKGHRESKNRVAEGFDAGNFGTAPAEIVVRKERASGLSRLFQRNSRLL